MQQSQPVPLFMGKQSIGLKSALIVAAAASAGWFGYRAFTAQRVSRETDRLAGILELRPTSNVADVGAGDGAYSLELASRVVTQGQVFATEIEQEDVANIRAEAVAAGLDNITVIQAGEGSSNLPAGCCDAIFLRGVYHHITKPAETNRSFRDALRPGGGCSSIRAAWFLPRSFAVHGVPPTVVGTGAACCHHFRSNRRPNCHAVNGRAASTPHLSDPRRNRSVMVEKLRSSNQFTR